MWRRPVTAFTKQGATCAGLSSLPPRAADDQRSHLVILDARDVEAGPVALLRFRDPIPSGLHGCWSSAYYGPLQPS
jgi:hypothetical protein